MLYKAKKETEEAAALAETLKPVITGLGFFMVELILSRHKGSCQVRIVVARPPAGHGEDVPSGTGREIGTSELGRLHKALLPRLELALAGDFSVELSSPGIDRTIKEGAEFGCFLGRMVRCYTRENSDWIRGILKASDEKGIVFENGDGELKLEYERIAKAKLDG